MLSIMLIMEIETGSDTHRNYMRILHTRVINPLSLFLTPDYLRYSFNYSTMKNHK